MGGSIQDYGISLAVRNGKALMAGTSNSPIIAPSNTPDVVLVEIDKEGDNQCELFNKADITKSIFLGEYNFVSTSFKSIALQTALITSDVTSSTGLYSTST